MYSMYVLYIQQALERPPCCYLANRRFLAIVLAIFLTSNSNCCWWWCWLEPQVYYHCSCPCHDQVPSPCYYRRRCNWYKMCVCVCVCDLISFTFSLLRNKSLILEKSFSALWKDLEL